MQYNAIGTWILGGLSFTALLLLSESRAHSMRTDLGKCVLSSLSLNYIKQLRLKDDVRLVLHQTLEVLPPHNHPYCQLK